MVVKMKAPGKQYIIAILILSLWIGNFSMGTVWATSSTQQQLEEAERENEETEAALDANKENLGILNEEKNTLEGELNTLNAQLAQVSSNLEDLEDQIEKKLEEIETTQAELVVAKETEEWQYECMKKRIQFMYEQSDYVYTEILLTTVNFSEFLNKSAYIEQLSEYDREQLTLYEETRAEIEETEARLLEEEEALQVLREETEAEQNKFMTYVNQTSANISQYASNISAAEQAALEYEAEVKEQEDNITYLKKKLAEEIALSKLAAQSKWRDISEISFAEGDRYLLANLIYCEAGGEPYAGQLAVGAVVINRVLSSVYPETLSGVIYQSSQFSPVGSGRLALALAENKATAACYKAADEAMEGHTNVGTCVYFRTPIEGLTGISIGGHIFY